MSAPPPPGDATGPPPHEPVALDLRDHVLFDAARPVHRAVAEGTALRLGLVCLEPRQALPAGIADTDRLYTVIGGRAWVVVDDAEVTLDPLQAVLVPHGAAYGVRNDSPDPLILQVVTGPGPAVRGQDEAPSGAAVARDTAAHRPAETPVGGPEGAAVPAPESRGAKPDVWTRLRRLLGSE